MRAVVLRVTRKIHIMVGKLGESRGTYRMKKRFLTKWPCILIFFLYLLISFEQISSQEKIVQYTIAESSTLKVHGKSTIHNFTIHAGEMQGRLQVNPAVMDSSSLQAIGENPMGTFSIPVEQLRGGNLLFNRDLHKSLQANIYPNISYQLTAFQPVDTTGGGTEWLPINTEGELTITRATRTVHMQIEGRWTHQDHMEFRGTKTLSISEFGIDPPARLFGALQVGDTVEVDFHIHLQSEHEDVDNNS